MRLFGSERISKLMDKMGLEEGEVIQHSMISKSIERAQKKVEENNFGQRKRLLEYDDVMNAQREVIYAKRKNALYGDRLSIDISNMFMDAIETVIHRHAGSKNYDAFKVDIISNFGIESPISEEEFERESAQVLFDKLATVVVDTYKKRKEGLAQTTFPVIKDVYQNQSDQFVNLSVPFTNGVKVLQISVNLEKAFESEGLEVVKQFERSITLSIIDQEWKEHLREMDDLKQNVNNASAEQKDPLLIYKEESFKIFTVMFENLNLEIVAFLMKAGILQQGPESNPTPAPARPPLQSAGKPQIKATRGNLDGSIAEEEKPNKPITTGPVTGRNEPCPCGSGKKFKQCHGQK
jgi:preprotein translocase subunit SecA